MPIYDVENRFSYYKSYSDNIMSGSALPALGSSTWDRGVIGSVVSGSEEWRASTLLSDFLFKNENPFFRSGETRYLRLSSNSQTIKDTIAPDLLGIYTTGSWGSGSVATAFNFTGVPQGSLLLFAADRKAITGSNGQRVNNIEWTDSYPFEKKYYLVPPESNNDIYENVTRYEYLDVAVAGEIFRPATAAQKAALIDKSRYVVPAISRVVGVYKMLSTSIDVKGYWNGAYFSSGDSIGAYGSSNLISGRRGFFGINPNPLQLEINPSPKGEIYNFTSITGFTAEGWKYGLYNGVPTNFSAVFRQNHYGQFRDMLEQRIYTATYNNPQIGGPMDANGGIKFISGSSLAGESNNKLTASIYAADNVTEAYRVNPYGSGIFDTLYRASQPWHADDTRPKFEFPRRVEV